MNWIAVVGVVAVVLGLLAAARILPAIRRRKSYDVQEFSGFLSAEECAHLIERAEPLLKKSSVIMDGERGVDAFNRASGTAFIPQAGDRIIQDIKQRIADLSKTPVENQEQIQVTHYFPGERFDPHYDSLRASKLDPGPAGDRHCTVIIYLSEDYDDGFTVFPRIRRRVKPELGKAVLFHNLTKDGKSWDHNALHYGERVTSGEKWLTNQWIRQHRRHPDQPRRGGAKRRRSGRRSSPRKR